MNATVKTAAVVFVALWLFNQPTVQKYLPKF